MSAFGRTLGAAAVAGVVSIAKVEIQVDIVRVEAALCRNATLPVPRLSLLAQYVPLARG